MAKGERKCSYKPCGKKSISGIRKGPQFWCSSDCVVKYAMEGGAKLRANQAREAKRQEREIKKEFREYKKAFKDKDHSYQFKETKKAAQKLANRLDAHLPCICCDTPRTGQQFCGGHFKTAKAHPELALSLLNIHGQANKNCNEGKSGNISGDKYSKGYKQGLLDRYGQWIVDYLESYHPPRKFTCQELIAMRAAMAADTRRLEKGLPPLKDWRAPVYTNHHISPTDTSELSTTATSNSLEGVVSAVSGVARVSSSSS